MSVNDVFHDKAYDANEETSNGKAYRDDEDYIANEEHGCSAFSARRVRQLRLAEIARI